MTSIKSFVYDILTKVYFGPEEMSHLPEEIKKYGSKVLFMYGGDYVKRYGIYDIVANGAKKYGYDFVEFREIKPNPRHTDVQKGIDICRQEGCDVILAVGGGSCIDSAKVIASGYYIDAPAWDVVLGKHEVKNSLPIITVSTIAATGSEMNYGAVISNLETKDKKSLRRPTQRPKVSFLNPEYTYSVGKYQTACGSMDIICHTIESYFTSDESMYFLDSVMEGLIRTVFKYGPICYNDPTNYEARANVMWASSWAINDFIRNDKYDISWSMHPIEHEISAFYDITHGLGLAIIMPRYLRSIIDEKSLKRFRKLGVYALDIDSKLSDEEIANEVIKKIENLAFKTFELTSNFTDLNITDEYFKIIADKLCVNDGYFIGYRKLSKNDVVEVLKDCL